MYIGPEGYAQVIERALKFVDSAVETVRKRRLEAPIVRDLLSKYAQYRDELNSLTDPEQIAKLTNASIRAQYLAKELSQYERYLTMETSAYLLDAASKVLDLLIRFYQEINGLVKPFKLHV